MLPVPQSPCEALRAPETAPRGKAAAMRCMQGCARRWSMTVVCPKPPQRDTECASTPHLHLASAAAYAALLLRVVVESRYCLSALEGSGEADWEGAAGALVFVSRHALSGDSRAREAHEVPAKPPQHGCGPRMGLIPCQWLEQHPRNRQEHCSSTQTRREVAGEHG